MEKNRLNPKEGKKEEKKKQNMQDKWKQIVRQYTGIQRYQWITLNVNEQNTRKTEVDRQLKTVLKTYNMRTEDSWKNIWKKICHYEWWRAPFHNDEGFNLPEKYQV